MAIIGNSIVAVRPIDTELSSTSENAIANKTVNAAIASVRNEIGTPLVANTAAEMTDTNKIYVYVGSETGYTNGNWYYYDGSHWVSGGVYNSQGFETDKTLMISDAPADAKTVGDKFDETDQNIQNTKDEIEEDIGELSNAISQKAPVIINTASGNVVSFADGADGGKIRNVVGTIVTPEGGSGWTGANISAAGVNILGTKDADNYFPTNIPAGIAITVSNKAATTTRARFYRQNKTEITNVFLQSTGTGDFEGYRYRTTTLSEPCYFIKFDTQFEEQQCCFGTKIRTYKNPSLVNLPINWQTEAGSIYNGSFTLNEDGSVDVVNSDSGNSYRLTNVGSLSTLYGYNNIWIDTGAITECDYPADTKLYVDGLTAPDEDMIADGLIASGKYFTVNNQLYLSTAQIAAGAQIIPGSNCTATSITEALNALNT